MEGDIVTPELLAAMDDSIPIIVRMGLEFGTHKLSNGEILSPMLQMVRDQRMGVVNFPVGDDHGLMLYRLAMSRLRIEAVCLMFEGYLTNLDPKTGETLDDRRDALFVCYECGDDRRNWSFYAIGNEGSTRHLVFKQEATEGAGTLYGLLDPFDLTEIPVEHQAEVARQVDQLVHTLSPMFDGPGPNGSVH